MATTYTKRAEIWFYLFSHAYFDDYRNETTTISYALKYIEKAMEYYRERPPLPITLDADFIKKIYAEVDYTEELLKQYKSELNTLVSKNERD